MTAFQPPGWPARGYANRRSPTCSTSRPSTSACCAFRCCAAGCSPPADSSTAAPTAVVERGVRQDVSARRRCARPASGPAAAASGARSSAWSAISSRRAAGETAARWRPCRTFTFPPRKFDDKSHATGCTSGFRRAGSCASRGPPEGVIARNAAGPRNPWTRSCPSPASTAWRMSATARWPRNVFRRSLLGALAGSGAAAGGGGDLRLDRQLGRGANARTGHPTGAGRDRAPGGPHGGAARRGAGAGWHSQRFRARRVRIPAAAPSGVGRAVRATRSPLPP